MFRYLFRDTVDASLEVFTAKDKMEGSDLLNNKLMREFIKKHFPNGEYIVNRGETEVEIPWHLRNHRGNELVALGAYRRSEISQ